MIAVWIVGTAGVVLTLGYALSRLTAAPAARGVSLSARFAEARRIAADATPSRPCDPRRRRPRSYVAHCNSGAALGLRPASRR
jgi:hypothetical protein